MHPGQGTIKCVEIKREVRRGNECFTCKRVRHYANECRWNLELCVVDG